jgi:hypothetical protein
MRDFSSVDFDTGDAEPGHVTEDFEEDKVNGSDSQLGSSPVLGTEYMERPDVFDQEYNFIVDQAFASGQVLVCSMVDTVLFQVSMNSR